MINTTRLRLNGKRRRLPPLKDRSTMAIYTGLSVTVAGHLVFLRRDEAKRVAEVVAEPMLNHVVTGLEQEAVRDAADALLRRAQRFLGRDWKIIPYRVGQRPAASA